MPPRRDTLLVFVFFLCAYWLSNSGFDTSEATFHYQVAHRLITSGRLSFDEVPVGIFTTAPDGRTFGSHEIGNAVLLLPTAALNQALYSLAEKLHADSKRLERLEQFVVSFQAAVYAAFTLALLHRILTREYGQSVRQAFLGACALGFCTFYWNYARSLFDGMLCGLLLLAALLALLKYRRTGSLKQVAIAFVCLGYSVDTRLSMVVLLAASFGFAVLARPASWWKAMLVAGLVLLPFAAWQMHYNQLRTGNPMLAPVQSAQYADNNALDGDLFDGLLGLTVSPGKGLFIYAPLLLLSLVALPRFLRRDRLVAGFILVGGGLWLILHAKLRNWYGAWGWGPRHMVTVLPLFALPGLVHLPELWQRRWGRWIILFTLIAGFILALAAEIANYHYRMELARRENCIADAVFIWSVPGSQSVDMIVAAGRNLLVVAGVEPPLNIPEMSDLNNYASNRINFWWITLPRAGLPRPVVFAACVPLAIVTVWSGRRLLKTC